MMEQASTTISTTASTVTGQRVVLFHLLPKADTAKSEKEIRTMANVQTVMKRASELRKQGMPNSMAMRQAWAEARAAEAKEESELDKQ